MAIPMPGPYEVSNTIQAILQRRREQSRQAMLDKLNGEQTRAQMAAQQRTLAQGDAQIALEERRTAATEAQTTQQGAESAERIFQSQRGSLPRAGVPTSQIKDTGFLEELRKRAMTKIQPASDVDTFTPYGIETEVTPNEADSLNQMGTVPGVQMSTEHTPEQEVVIGSPEHQQEEEDIRRVDSITGQPGFDDLSPAEKFKLFYRAGIKNPPESVLRGNRNLRVVSPSGQVGDPISIGQYDDVVQTAWQPGSYFGGAGGVIPTRVVMRNPKTGEEVPLSGPRASIMDQVDQYEAQGWTLLRIGNDPVPQKAGTVTAGMATQLISTKRNYEFFLDQEKNKRPWQGASADLGPAKAAYEQALGNVFAASGASSDVQDLAMQIATNEQDRGKSLSQILQEQDLAEANNLSPADLQALQRLLNYATGVFVE